MHSARLEAKIGKTLTNILTVGAAIAINVVPGLGQALSGAIFGALGTITGTVGTLASVAFSVAQFAPTALTLAGLQSGASLLGLGPSQPRPETTEFAIKTSRPPRVSAYGRSRLYGAYCLFETSIDGTAVDVYAMHEGQLDAIEAYYLGDDVVTLTGSTVNAGDDGRYKAGAVNLYTSDGSVPGAGLPAITTLIPGWTGRGDGVVLLGQTAKSVKAKVFQETYPSSTVPAPSLVARWQKCPDPAADDPLDESTWTWTENGVRQALHYELVRTAGRPDLPKSDAGYAAALLALRQAWWARKIAPTLDYWIEAAAVCDEAVPLKAGGTEPRYRSCVAHKHTDQHKQVRAALQVTFDGWIAPRGDGALVIFAGKYYEPDEADAIGPEHIVSYTWDHGPPDDDQAVNEIICSYVSADHDFNDVECEAWRDNDDISRRGQELSQPLDARTPSWGQARRLAKIRMARINAPNRGTITTNIAGRKVRGKRFIPLRIEEAGTVFFDGIAEITALTRELKAGVRFQWVAVDPASFDWNAATEEGEPAAKGNRVAPDPLDTPSINTAVAVAGDATAQINLDVDGPAREDLTWFTRWKLSADSAWSEQETTDTDAGSPVALSINLVPLDASIDAQVAYAVGDGRRSDWSATEVVDTSGGAPTAATSFTAADGVGQSVLQWTNPNSAGLSFARVYHGTTNVFGAATQVGGDMAAARGAVQTYTHVVGAGTHYYWVRLFSGSGAGSATTGPDAATVT